MSFLQRAKAILTSFMAGRYGSDQLGLLTLSGGLVISLAGSFANLGVLSLAGLILYGITLFRMFSRNKEARIRENQKYLSLSSGWIRKIRQFLRRLKNRKEYKYFRCPKCRVLLRLKRGCGEKKITCAKCGHQFHQKA